MLNFMTFNRHCCRSSTAMCALVRLYVCVWVCVTVKHLWDSVTHWMSSNSHNSINMHRLTFLFNCISKSPLFHSVCPCLTLRWQSNDKRRKRLHLMAMSRSRLCTTKCDSAWVICTTIPNVVADFVFFYNVFKMFSSIRYVYIIYMKCV